MPHWLELVVEYQFETGATRCRRFLAYEWRELYEESAPYAPSPFSPTAAAARDAVQRDRRQLYERSGFAANKYGNRKDKDYNAIISAKNLDLHYQSVTFGTFGSFGTGTWSVITKACDPTSHPRALDDYNPWNAPGPKRDFILSERR